MDTSGARILGEATGRPLKCLEFGSPGGCLESLAANLVEVQGVGPELWAEDIACAEALREQTEFGDLEEGRVAGMRQAGRKERQRTDDRGLCGMIWDLHPCAEASLVLLLFNCQVLSDSS